MYSILPSSVLGANEKVNLACIGIGGQGGGIANTLFRTGHANVVALCDVNMGAKSTSGIMNKFPDAPKFKDFRKMFDKMEKDIDAFPTIRIFQSRCLQCLCVSIYMLKSLWPTRSKKWN